MVQIFHLDINYSLIFFTISMYRSNAVRVLSNFFLNEFNRRTNDIAFPLVFMIFPLATLHIHLHHYWFQSLCMGTFKMNRPLTLCMQRSCALSECRTAGQRWLGR